MQRLAPSLLLLLTSCTAATAAEVLAKRDWQRHFDAHGVRGTFVLYEVFRWDGQPKPRKSWERDHDLNTGMQESVVWMFQEVARRTGKARMRQWLERFDYGNKDIAGGIEHFWLQGALGISAMEQVAFLRKLEEGRLPVGARSRRLVRDALLVERSATHSLYAKTGSTGAVREPVSWWVGWIEKHGRPVAYFAMNVTPTKKSKFGERFAIARAILREAGALA